MSKFVVIFIIIAVTLYQTYRGYALQWHYGMDKTGPAARRVVLFCLADAFTYFVFAATGFLALFKFGELSHASAGGGHPVLLILLFLYGIAGITGKLPDLLGKLKPGQ